MKELSSSCVTPCNPGPLIFPQMNDSVAPPLQACSRGRTVAASRRAFSGDEARLVKLAAVAVLFLALLRLIIAPWTELLPEEAYYWMYSQHPAAGYFDHPPMVAWTISAGTAILGNTALGVRFVTILLFVASSGLVYILGRHWFGRRAGAWAALAYAFLPIYAGAGFIVTPDQALLFFWLVALCAFSSAVESGRWGWWLLGGLGFGGALLSKYYAVLLGPSLLLFLLVSPCHRRWLTRPQPWVAFALALALFVPVVWWNSQHEWASFLFQSGRTKGGSPHMIRNVLGFWGVQAVILTPVAFVWAGITVSHGLKQVWRQRDEAWNFALSFSLPLLLLFAAASFKTEVHVNWTAPGFLPLLPAGAALALERWTNSGRVWRFATIATGVLCIIAFLVGASSLVWGIPHLYEQAGGWRGLGRSVLEAKRELGSRTGFVPFVIGADKYDYAAEMGFELGEPDDTINDFALGSPGLSFRYWMSPEKFEGRPAVVVMEAPRPGLLRKLNKHFTRVEEPIRLEVNGPGFHKRTVYLVKCHGYQHHKY
jgi:dolichol-phosphate mannosyltransferase